MGNHFFSTKAGLKMKAKKYNEEYNNEEGSF